MKIAILGAGGQVGTALLKRYAKEPSLSPVAVLRNAVSAARHEQIDGVEVRVGDVSDEEARARLVGDCDAIINCALAAGLPREARAANAALVEGIAAVARKTGRLRAIVHLSSVAVYGSIYHPTTGSSFERPRATTSYGRDKLYAERVARSAFAKGDVSLFVVRLGHVYGPAQANSRAFIAMARAGVALPFSGSLPSNAIHADRLASLLASACRGEIAAGTYNGVDHPNRTWREVFDWHTAGAGLSPVKDLSDDRSNEMRERFLRDERTAKVVKLTREISRAFTSAPVAQLAVSPAVRDLSHGLLSALPHAVERRVKAAYTHWSVGRQVARLGAQQSSDLGAEFFSEAVPGPSLADGVAIDEAALRPALANEFAAWAGDTAVPAWFG